MNYQIECDDCHATCWVRGSAEEPDTNAVVIDEEDLADADVCEHIMNGGEYTIIDAELVFDEGD